MKHSEAVMLPASSLSDGRLEPSIVMLSSAMLQRSVDTPAAPPSWRMRSRTARSRCALAFARRDPKNEFRRSMFVVAAGPVLVVMLVLVRMGGQLGLDLCHVERL